MLITKIELEKLNSSINQNKLLERRQLSTLTINKPYKLKEIKNITTKFGKTILAVLEDTSDNATFETFLPKRIIDYMSEEIIEKFNKDNCIYSLTYLGQVESSVKGSNPTSLLKFDVL